MTSSIRRPRTSFALRSPRTHLNASTTLLLPEPLGPTMAVTPESKVISVWRAKVLKPASLMERRRTWKAGYQPACGMAAMGRPRYGMGPLLARRLVALALGGGTGRHRPGHDRFVRLGGPRGRGRRGGPGRVVGVSGHEPFGVQRGGVWGLLRGRLLDLARPPGAAPGPRLRLLRDGLGAGRLRAGRLGAGDGRGRLGHLDRALDLDARRRRRQRHRLGQWPRPGFRTHVGRERLDPRRRGGLGGRARPLAAPAAAGPALDLGERGPGRLLLGGLLGGSVTGAQRVGARVDHRRVLALPADRSPGPGAVVVGRQAVALLDHL